MAFCTNCGKPVDDRDTVCSNCGAPVESAGSYQQDYQPNGDYQQPQYQQDYQQNGDYQQPQYQQDYQQNGDYQQPQYQQDYQQNGNYQPMYQQPVQKNPDSGSFGWAVLGFFVPIVGIILFFVWKNDKPRCAKKAGLGALIYAILYVIYFIIMFAVGLLMF